MGGTQEPAPRRAGRTCPRPGGRRQAPRGTGRRGCCGRRGAAAAAATVAAAALAPEGAHWQRRRLRRKGAPRAGRTACGWNGAWRAGSGTGRARGPGTASSSGRTNCVGTAARGTGPATCGTGRSRPGRHDSPGGPGSRCPQPPFRACARARGCSVPGAWGAGCSTARRARVAPAGGPRGPRGPGGVESTVICCAVSGPQPTEWTTLLGCRGPPACAHATDNVVHGLRHIVPHEGAALSSDLFCFTLFHFSLYMIL